MNPNIDINTVDFEDNPVFSNPQDHYFDREDAYIDPEESYLIANLRAENAKKSSTTNANNGSGSSSFWNLKKVLIVVAVIFGLGFFSKFAIILIALLSAIF